MRSLRIDQIVVAVLVFVFMAYLAATGHLLAIAGMVGIVIAAAASARARAAARARRGGS